MYLRTKPNANYGRNYLTSTGPPLLGSSRKNNGNTNDENVKDNADKDVPELGIDDDPRSSSDDMSEEEGSDSDLSDDPRDKDKKRDKPAGKTLEEKLAADDGADETETTGEKEGYGSNSFAVRKSRRRGNNFSNREDSNSPGKQEELSMKRDWSVFVGDDNSDNEQLIFASQNSNRTRQAKYGRSDKTYSKNKTSHSSHTPSATRSGSISRSQQENKVGDEPEKVEECDGGFRVPMQVDIASPPSKKRKPPSRRGTRNITQAVTSNSPKPEVKRLLTRPDETVSDSSVTASSARDSHIFEADDNLPSSPLSSPLSSAPSVSLELTQEEKIFLDSQESSTESNESLCPMCKQKVNPDLLRDFMSQPKRRVREQQRFCESHRQQSAEVEWKQRSFPEIDWETFDDRISRHFQDLEKLLVPECSTYYRNILDTALKSGKAKNFRLSLSGDGLENISCGYYGSRGAGKMLHAVTMRFSHRLRRLAATDHIVKTAGVAGYAQSVLVPELAMRLVKEDMCVGDETARQILRESIALGEKLNPALNDVVPVPERQDEE